MKTGLLSFACLLLTSLAFASDGYTYRDGYWYYSGGTDAYTRTWIPGYTSYGCAYPGYYQYTFHHAYSAPKVSVNTPNWRTKILEIASERERLAKESADFNNAIRLLGLNNYVNSSNYGGSYSYQANVPQGNTVYGYTYNSVTDLYGDASLSTLYQQANRLAENQQKLSGEATADFLSLIGADGQQRAKIAEILARGQAITQIAKSLDGNRSTVTENSSVWGTKDVTTTAPAPGGTSQINPLDSSGVAWEKSATECLQCHSPKTKLEGGLDMTLFRTFNPSRKIQIISRLLLPQSDPKHMPYKGRQYPPQEIKLWLSQ